MELLDYARFRWRALAVLFVLGLVVIAAAAVGGLTGRSQYVAQAQVLIRPPAAQINLFSYDLDRYVDTEIATLYSDSALESESSGTPFSPSELRNALSTSHDAGSDIVTFGVKAGSKSEAVSVVNHVARVYLADARDRGESSNQRMIKYLEGRVTDEQETLDQAERQLSRSFQRAGAETADPVLVNPAAYSQQQISTAAIQQLQQQLLEARSSSQGTNLSRVLSAAESAQPAVRPWRVTTILAAVVGLALALVAVTAIALSFSRRVISVDRWAKETDGSRLRPAVRGRAQKQRPGDLRRIVNDIANAGSDARVSVISFPFETKRTQRTVPGLVNDLSSAGFDSAAGDSIDLGRTLAAVEHRESGLQQSVTVAVVDLRACRLEDAAVLADGDPAVLSRFVPVLI